MELNHSASHAAPYDVVTHHSIPDAGLTASEAVQGWKTACASIPGQGTARDEVPKGHSSTPRPSQDKSTASGMSLPCTYSQSAFGKGEAASLHLLTAAAWAQYQLSLVSLPDVPSVRAIACLSTLLSHHSTMVLLDMPCCLVQDILDLWPKLQRLLDPPPLSHSPQSQVCSLSLL